MQKVLVTMVVVLLGTAVIYAQTPRTISYQGVLTDSLDRPKADGMYNFVFRLYTAGSGGSPVWTETKALQVSRGLFSTSLGDLAPLSLPFNTAYWLGIQVGADPELTPRIPLSASGYSLRAVVADTAQYARSAPQQSFIDSSRIAGTVGSGAVNTAQLAGGAVTPAKLSSSGASSGQVLKFNGTNVVWANDQLGGLTLPFGGTSTSGASAFTVNTTSGRAGTFMIDNAAGADDALSGFTNGDGVGVHGKGNKAAGVWGEGQNASGVYGTSASLFGVQGISDVAAGVYGKGPVSGVEGEATATSGKTTGVSGVSFSATGSGVFGSNLSSANGGIGVTGTSNNGFGVNGSGITGVYGFSPTSTSGVGVLGIAEGSSSICIQGSGANYGIWGQGANIGVYAHNTGGTPGRDAYLSTASLAADLYGNVVIHGSISKSSGSFKIDHPLDPANKYLYHSFVESPDMKNIYDGVVTLDGGGQATVTLPAWFEALNKEFRYQLTAIGAPAPGLYIAQKVSGNTFRIAGGAPGMEVSWQVTGVRQDAWANAHRIPVEEEKPAAERGFYDHPELFGQPESRSLLYAAHPETQKMAEEAQRTAEVQRMNQLHGGARP